MAAYDDGSSRDDESPRASEVGYVRCQSIQAPAAAPLALGTLLCRSAGALRLVVIAKAAFDMRATPMKPLGRPAIHQEDTGDFVEMPTVASDLVPGRTRVDVTLDGHAHAAADGVRLAIHQGGTTVVDKRLPFTSADEGPPLHGGRNELTDGVGFGPIGAASPLRQRYLTDAHRAGLRAPVMTLSADFDWRFFQAAPSDQQLEHLAPDATFTVDGAIPDHPHLRAQLPHVRARGSIFGLDLKRPEHPHPLTFRADSVHIHAEQATCVVCWRAVVEVASEAMVPTLTVVAGVATSRGDLPLPPAPPSPRRAPVSGTHDVAALLAGLPEIEPLPFRAGGGGAPPASLPRGNREGAPLRGRTLSAEELMANLPPSATLPFGAGATPPKRPAKRAHLRGTVDPDSRPSPEGALPFRPGLPSRAQAPSPAETAPTRKGQTIDAERLQALGANAFPFGPAPQPPAAAPVVPPPAPAPVEPSAPPSPTREEPSAPAAAATPPPPAREDPPIASAPASRPPERIVKVPSADAPPRKPKRKKKKPKRPVQRASKRTDLNALLYGKKP